MTKVLECGRGRQRSQCSRDVMPETQPAIVALKMRVGKQGRNGGGLQKGKIKTFSPRASEKELSLASTLIFSLDNLIFTHSDPFQNSGFQNCRLIDLCCFKPLTLL